MAEKEDFMSEPGSQQLDDLIALFQPLVDAAVRPLVLRQAAATQPATDEEIKQVLELFEQMGLAQGADPAELKKALADAERELRHPTPLTPEETEDLVEEMVLNTALTLVSNWLNAFFAAADAGGQGTVEAKTLDDAMLPPLDQLWMDDFDSAFDGCLIGAAQAKDVLRQVKRALPAGQMLPDDAVTLLSLNGVFVI